MGPTADSVKRSLTNVRPSDDSIMLIEHVRHDAKNLVDSYFRSVPESPERSLACRALEESVMWAVKAICLNDPNAREIPIGEK